MYDVYLGKQETDKSKHEDSAVMLVKKIILRCDEQMYDTKYVSFALKSPTLGSSLLNMRHILISILSFHTCDYITSVRTQNSLFWFKILNI